VLVTISLACPAVIPVLALFVAISLSIVSRFTAWVTDICPSLVLSPAVTYLFTPSVISSVSNTTTPVSPFTETTAPPPLAVTVILSWFCVAVSHVEKFISLG